MNFRLDLGKFKKIASDEATTTLQHPEGHTIKVAHKSLNPKMKMQLDKLPVHKAFGEDIGSSSAANKESSAQTLANSDSPQMLQDAQPQAAAPQQPQAPVTINIAAPTPIAQSPMLDPNKPGFNGLLEPNQAIALQQEMAAKSQNPQIDPSKLSAADVQKLSQQVAPQDQQEIPVSAPQLQAQMVPPPAQAPRAPASSGESPMAGFADLTQKGVNLQQKAIEEQAQATKELSAAQSGVESERVAELQDQRAKMLETQKKAADELNKLTGEIKANEIKPQHYLENMGAVQKVRTAIGLILGGIGGGLMHQENPALKFLQSQIERDVAAQKANQDVRTSLYAHYNQYFRNSMDAEAFTRAAINDMYSHMIDQAAAESKSKQADAVRDELKGKLLQQNAFLLGSMGASQGGSGGSIDDTLSVMRIVNPERAKEIESRYIPGVGLASIPIDNKAREQVTMRKALQDQITNLRSWAKAHEGSLNPEDVAYGKTLAKTVQDAYRRANGQGVFREAEAKFVNGIVDEDPSKFLNKFRVDPKYRALENSNLMELNGLYDSLGLKNAEKPIQQSGNRSGAGFVPKSFRPVR